MPEPIDLSACPDPLESEGGDRSPVSAPDPSPAPSELKPETGNLTPVPRYLVGILYYGAVDREHDRCVKALAGHPYILDVMELTGCPYIDMGRSIIATRVLDHPEIGGLLFIDHDMVFEPGEVEKVIESAEQSKGVAGAAYSMRRPGRIIGAIDGGKLEPGKKVVFFDGGEPVPAQHLGMGMTAIHRSVFERLVHASDERVVSRIRMVAGLRELVSRCIPSEPERSAALHSLETLENLLPNPDLPRLTPGISDAAAVPFFSHLQRLQAGLPGGSQGVYIGEDVSFCVRCHEAGIPVLLDTRARVYHKGSYCYGLEDVGLQVPFFARLEVLDTGTTEPTAKPALFSTDPIVQAAINHEYHPERVALPSAPET
jgi:hypothetical protein